LSLLSWICLIVSCTPSSVWLIRASI
jgi:hypothetical protein